MSSTKQPARITNYFMAYQHTREELPWLRTEEFEGLVLPRPVVLVNGVFDVLHSSHMRLLFAAREKAATLVCAMDSDEMVRKKKGAKRPILNWIERYVSLSYMPLDYIVEIGSDREFKQLVRVLKPDLRVQGVDHIDDVKRDKKTRRMYIRDGAMRTSEIVQRIVERELEIK